MADIRPFTGIHYPASADLSAVVAPPYDVLDDAGRAALVARSPHNIVQVDLPFMPPKVAGPDAVYEQANATLQKWLAEKVLVRDHRASLYPYQQTYTLRGRTYHRRGMFCLVKLTPFGVDIMPHEKTYKGPIEDRLKLMRATKAQLSPIFGLYSDKGGFVNKLLWSAVSKPQYVATLDGVKSEMWSVHDADIERKVIDFLDDRPIYIADGHHRYTTALQYQREAEEKNGGPLPPSHPANFCLFTLVPLEDDGLVILPTHRLIGGLDSFDVARLTQALAATFDVAETTHGPGKLPDLVDSLDGLPPHSFGLYDVATKKTYTLTAKSHDVLAQYEPGQSVAWRQLDVAILQRFLLDEVIAPTFAAGKEITRGYTAYAEQIVPMTAAKAGQYQLVLMLKSTPLGALEDLAKVGEVMPQKSTFFFPKLATGMIINPM